MAQTLQGDAAPCPGKGGLKLPKAFSKRRRQPLRGGNGQGNLDSATGPPCCFSTHSPSRATFLVPWG